MDTNVANNDSLVQVSVSTAGAAQADLAVFKNHSTPNVLHGGKLAFQLVAVNHGPAAVSAARLQDLMPSGVEDMRGPAVRAVVRMRHSVRARRRYPSAGGDAVGASITIDVTGAMAQAGGHLVNTASVASELPDPCCPTTAHRLRQCTCGRPQIHSHHGLAGAEFAVGLHLVAGRTVAAAQRGLGQPAQLDAGLAAGAGLGRGGDSHAIFVNGDFESKR
ncbi:hypothetical protein [Comamonas sp. JC664]|uniref:hypothetical protein n=1 Tax=Comamonas sp. JC664 TaxID=2801917 RepID=UPI003608532A